MKKIKPIKTPKCPYCKQRMTAEWWHLPGEAIPAWSCSCYRRKPPGKPTKTGIGIFDYKRRLLP